MFEHSLVCGVTIEVAWSFWTDVRNWALDADVESVEIDGPFAAGTRGFTNSKSSGRVEWRIAEAQIGRAVIKFPLAGAIGRFIWTFEDIGGNTRLTQRCTLGGEQADIFAKAVGPNLEAGIPGACESFARRWRMPLNRTSPPRKCYRLFPPWKHWVLEYSPFLRYDVWVGKWCTVTVADSEGRRYSLDVNAASSYDAAHFYLTHVRGNPGCGLPIPTTATTFEVVADGRVLHVSGARLKTWIENRREDWKGPRGILFSQRPMIGD